MATNASNAARSRQIERAEVFRKLHIPGNPVVLYNIWDAGSAVTVADAGAEALATSSWAVAKAYGFEDGEKIPYALALENLCRIVGAVDLPVSFDLESAYAEEPDGVAQNILLAIEAGAIGCNFEDSIPTTGAIRETATQVARVRAARKAADAAGVPFFINARCDLFFQGDTVPHDNKLLAKLIARAEAYAEAGASGLFAPGLSTISLIADLTKKSPLPVNVLASSADDVQVLADNGIARISFGATPYGELIDALEKAARAVMG